MDTIHIKKPVPLEQKEITDAIDSLQVTKKNLDDAPLPTNCPAHSSLSKAISANITANVLSLRLQENILYTMQNGNSKSFLSWGKLQAGGLAAVILAIVVAIIVILNTFGIEFLL